MTKYDDSSWHYGENFPKNYPIENASTHIGMFFAWILENDLFNQEFYEEELEIGDDILAVKNHEITGRDFFLKNCDEKFIDEDLNDLGNEFAEFYYGSDRYLHDYVAVFWEDGNNYKVADTWENYAILKLKIDKAFQEFLKIKNQ